MGLLDNIQSLLGGNRQSSTQNAPGQGEGLADSLGALGNLFGVNLGGSKASSGQNSLVSPALLSGLLGAFMGSAGKSGKNSIGKILLSGGGASLAASLWTKYKDRLLSGFSSMVAPADVAADASVSVNSSAARIIKALVFAAKSDGNIDEQEWQTIRQQAQQLNLGPETEQLIQEAAAQTPDPQLIAQGVTNPGEAMQLYFASCAVVDADNFMESQYLSKLAEALHIPAEVKTDISEAINQAQQ